MYTARKEKLVRKLANENNFIRVYCKEGIVSEKLFLSCMGVDNLRSTLHYKYVVELGMLCLLLLTQRLMYIANCQLI